MSDQELKIRNLEIKLAMLEEKFNTHYHKQTNGHTTSRPYRYGKKIEE